MPSELAAALAALQADPPRITKRGKGQVGNREYKYATLDAVWRALRPWMERYGLVWICLPTLDAMHGKPVLTYSLEHIKTGERWCGNYPLIDAHGQALGADITYARRYALCAVLGLLADEDTDGRSIEPRQRTKARVTGADHERLRYGSVERTPEDRPAERVTSGQNPVDMWMDNPKGEFDIGTPEDRPGSIDRQQEKLMHQAFNRLGIADRAVRLGMTEEIIGRAVMTSKQLSRLEADHLIKALETRMANNASA